MSRQTVRLVKPRRSVMSLHNSWAMRPGLWQVSRLAGCRRIAVDAMLGQCSLLA
ncbi:hypothetical protein HMPREF9946_00067 [Acetobacteraceae bacterium AT-5844]|nr:hypothetical protein HMPREF9946_00067 [Acetobacteraceae bacterium AT-5844]